MITIKVGLKIRLQGFLNNKNHWEYYDITVLEYFTLCLVLTNDINWNIIGIIFHHLPSGSEGENIRV